MFSLVPRCQGAIGSQKYTLQLSAEDSTRCPANSLPWSTVNDLRRFAGMFLNAAIAASVNALCVLSGSLLSGTYRLFRSTCVAMHPLQFAPRTVSLSQSPILVSALFGRSCMEWSMLLCPHRLVLCFPYRAFRLRRSLLFSEGSNIPSLMDRYMVLKLTCTQFPSFLSRSLICSDDQRCFSSSVTFAAAGGSDSLHGRTQFLRRLRYRF